MISTRLPFVVVALALALPCSAPLLAQDDDSAEDGSGEDEPPPVDPDLVAKLKETLSVQHRLQPGNVLSLTYPFSDPAELNDWKGKGLDKVDVREVVGGGGRKEVGCELGAGSRSAGTFLHNLGLLGASEFSLEFETWAAHNSPSAVFCVLLSKKVGVAWGQTICKPKNLRPYNKRSAPDKTLYREERTVRFNIAWKDNVLTVKCNGKLTDKRTFKKGELKTVQLGLIVRNMRVVINNLSLKGELDPKSVK